MSRPVKWPDQRLKESVKRACSIEWWSTSEGCEFLEQIDLYLSPGVASWLLRNRNHSVEISDVTHSLLLTLIHHPKLHQHLLDKSDSWAYLAGVARHCCASRSAFATYSFDNVNENFSGIAEDVGETHLTPLPIVMEKTTEALELFVRRRRRNLRAAVEWFALNPPTHQGHGHLGARSAHDLSSMGFTKEQIGGLANVTWGGRPNMHKTSLFYGYLTDPDFCPQTSRTHWRGLLALGNVFQPDFVDA